MVNIDELAAEVLSRTQDDPDALRQLIDLLDHDLTASPLRRTAQLWDVSTAQIGRMFGVSRQAAAKWMAEGPPAGRRDQVVALCQATDLLDRWIKRDRIAAVVRRPVAVLGGRTRLELALAGEFTSLQAELRDTFDLSRVAP